MNCSKFTEEEKLLIKRGKGIHLARGIITEKWALGRNARPSLQYKKETICLRGGGVIVFAGTNEC